MLYPPILIHVCKCIQPRGRCLSILRGSTRFKIIISNLGEFFHPSPYRLCPGVAWALRLLISSTFCTLVLSFSASNRWKDKTSPRSAHAWLWIWGLGIVHFGPWLFHGLIYIVLFVVHERYGGHAKEMEIHSVNADSSKQESDRTLQKQRITQ